MGRNWQIVLRLAFKQKNQKLSLKITGKMLRSSQIHRQLAKLGLQMNSSQQRFLNKRKKASVKNSNTEAGPVPLALFDQNSTVPHRARRGRWRFFKVQKDAIFDQRMLFNDPMDFFAFFTRFLTQKLFFHSETTRTPFGLPTRNLKRMPGRFLKIRLLCFSKR